MERWSRSDVVEYLGSIPAPRVVLVRGTLVSLANLFLLKDLEDTHFVYVDTWVDAPWVRSYVLSIAARYGIELVSLNPPWKFFGYVVGRGYPRPTEAFRWHTRRLYVEPLKRYVEENDVGSVILDSRVFDLPPEKRVPAFSTVQRGVGYMERSSVGVPVYFPFALATIGDVKEVVREYLPPGLFSLFSIAPRANCWLCDLPYQRSHLQFSNYLGAHDLLSFHDFYVRGSVDPENRIVDEVGYPRSLRPEFRVQFYSRYQSLATRLNSVVPEYLPLLPPLEVLQAF